MTNVSYREVKRKAAVGERIKIVNATITGGNYRNGSELTVREVDGRGLYVDGVRIWISDREYVVLEPLTAAVSAKALSLQSDPLYAAFRAFIVDNAPAIRAILPDLERGITAPCIAVSSAGSIKATGVSVSKPLTRAQVIAKATADVVELLQIGRDIYADIAPVSPFHNHCYAVRFNVNRDKRTVTALVNRGIVAERVPDAKAIAKAAPDDVFHAEIGKAIALRRALGLEIPGEYTNAPKPEKAEIGAKVYTASRYGTLTVARVTDLREEAVSESCYHSLRRDANLGDPRILDDTDVDYGATLTEGVAA
ncbi:hypothetical protein [Paenibacillus sp. FSL R7-0128]|uniref:hypothetical protein n=1 Tax=Paenibacillus sp. FSL R7-0128 TaxID=2954529 RepID=UPI0030FBFBF1